jgi:hypothetical protein
MEHGVPAVRRTAPTVSPTRKGGVGVHAQKIIKARVAGVWVDAMPC